METRRIVVGIGCPRMVAAEFVHDITAWCNGSHNHDVSIDWEQTPNRVDWSYSRIIAAAQKTDPEWLVLNDADVVPQTEFDQAAYYARKALAAGFDVDASPIMHVGSGFSMRPAPGVAPSFDEPFEVEFVSGGHWWISRRAFKALKPVSFFLGAGGQKEPFFFRIPDDRTEDVEMCKMFQKAGFKIAADPRLLTGHIKSIRLPSFRKGMESGKYVPNSG